MEINEPLADLDTLARQLKLLANPKRLRIMHMLMEGVQCNCILGDALQMPANLISHHMGLLREGGLVNMERDAVDSRWVYYTVNETALARLNDAFQAFFDLERIKPRQSICGPGEGLVPLATIVAEG